MTVQLRKLKNKHKMQNYLWVSFGVPSPPEKQLQDKDTVTGGHSNWIWEVI